MHRPQELPNPHEVSSSDQRVMTGLVLAALRRIMRAVDLHSRALVQRFGLTGPQLVVLRELLEHRMQTVGEVAHAVHLSQATVTGIVDRLEKKALVRRERSVFDRRRVMVLLTDQAERVLAEAPPLLQEHFVDAFGRLADWEQTQILSSLQRIVALMEAPALRSAGDLESVQIQDPALIPGEAPLDEISSLDHQD